jgi:acylpyruvate hydrolase
MPTQLVAYRTEAGIERIGARTADGVVHALDGDRNGLPEIVEAWTSEPDLGSDHPVEPGGVQLIAPVSARSRVFCVAQNYPAHAAEAGGDSPEVPIIFLKPQAAFVGGSEAIEIPGVTQALDYEGEVGVVIGKRGRAATEDDAWGLIGGYTLGNDGSARDLQPATLAGRFQVDWFSAKSIDRSSALGPGLVHACSFEPRPTIAFQLRLNGVIVQQDDTASMYHAIPSLVVYISRLVELLPGDVILTGTPAGVGKARGRYPAPGDVVEIDAGPLGTLQNRYMNV